MNLDMTSILAESLKGLSNAPRGQKMELGVLASAEFYRIKHLPKRGDIAEDLVSIMTAWLRSPFGTQTLRFVQALALVEAYENDGAFLPMGVGAGKTLVSLLLATVLAAQRPILIVPGALKEKTKRQALEYMKHWRIPNFLRILTYQAIGHPNGANLLERYDPDLLILDEGHRAKNKKAAVTKRILRHVIGGRANGKHIRCVVMSGTISKRSLHDFWHLIKMCLQNMSPLPNEWNEVEAWASCLDERPRALQRYRPGALLDLAEPEDHGSDEYMTARKAFRRRMISTPGVVATVEQGCDASILIHGHIVDHDAAMEVHWERLRSMWELPDGWPLADGFQVWAKALEMGRGFYYKCDPRPPELWFQAKKVWSSFVRNVLKDNRRNLDSEKQVALACINHPEWYGDQEYREWRAIKDTFKYKQVIEWLDENAMAASIDWLEQHGGVVWTEHVMFGETLSQMTGVPYFGQGGLTSDGQYIEDHKGPAILSVDSNREGRNLQYRPEWTRSLVVCWPPNGLACEQMLGRTHRPGQEADELRWDFLITCFEDVQVFDQTLKDAQYLVHMQGPQKLLIADTDVPDVYGKSGNAWSK